MKKNNITIRLRAKECGVMHWQIAEALGTTEFTFSRRLRHELPDEEKAKILAIIDRLAESEVHDGTDR